MLKKLSVSRKKKPTSKLANSRSKVNKQPQKQHIQIKQRKISNKHNHHVSTLSLLSNHNASQSSLVDQSKLPKAKKGKSKNRESSVCLVMKQGATKQKQRSKNKKQSKKGKKNSSSNNEKSKKTILKISPLKIERSEKNIKLTKQNGAKKSKICNQQQLYERINLGLFKSKTNSQINFSNNSSVRQNNNSAIGVSLGVNAHANPSNMGQGRHKKTLTIDCSDQYILNQYFSNSRIKNYDKKKVQAAVKIQKVFRGYLTRKMLQIYILKEEEKLYQLSKKAKNSSSRQSIDYEGHHFEDLAVLKRQQNEALKKNSNTKATPKMFMENLTVLNLPQSREDLRKRQRISEISDIQISMKDSKKQGLTPIDHEALDEQSSIYAHPHDSISRYLPFDIKNQEQNQHSQSLFYQNIGQHDAEYEESENLIKLKNSHRMMEDKSQELLKYTPSSYAPKSRSKVEDPMPTDFSDKRVEQFEFDGPESRSKQLQQESKKQKTQKPDPKSNNHIQLQPSTPIQTQPQPQNPIKTTNMAYPKQQQKQRKQISKLKKQQKQKWNVIIQMLNQQILQTKSRNLDHQKFMSMILQFSKKNKQQLEKSNSSFSIQDVNVKSQDQRSKFLKIVEEERFVLKNKGLLAVDQESQLVQSRRKSEGKQEVRMEKNMDLPLRDKKYTNLSINLYNAGIPKHTSPRYNKQNSSILDKTEELKKFYRKNWVNYPIQQMVYIREKALQKRQMDMVNKLNQDLYHQKLTHQQFIQRLSELQGKFESQRELVNKAKMDIFLGCRATHRLLQDSARDAWYLGYKIPFSQSLKQFPSNHTNIWVKDLIVDQLKSFTNQTIHKVNNTSKQSQINNQTIKQQKENEKVQNEYQYQYQKQKSQQKRKQDLSISLPHEDSSLTLRPSNQVSQQSLLSEEISYHQGDVEIHLLETQPNCNQGIIYDEEEEEDEQEDSYSDQGGCQYGGVVDGFRKITADKLVKKVEHDRKNIMIFGEGPLFIDPNEQQKVENQVMKKISINQPKLISNEAACRLEELRRYEMTPRHKTSSSLQPKSEIYKVDIGSESDEDEIIFNEDMDPEIKRITQDQITKLVWQTVNQIFVNQSMRTKFFKTKNRPPSVIEFEERIKFANLLVKQIPNFKILLPRINQKMVASRLELLKFMRVNFDEEEVFDEGELVEENLDMSDQFEQIGKFEHILPAEVCINALDKYMKQQQQNQQKMLNEIEQQSIQQKIQQKYKHHITSECLKKVTQRQQTLKQNKIQRSELRQQIKKVQYHCIFDSLNQILMKKRLKSTGYSGIGLNQLTLILQKQSIKQIKHEQQYIKMLNQSIEQLNGLLSNDKTNNQKLLMENYQRLCQNDSQWVYYTDEALSFALEIVYMLEDQIFFQEATIISKKICLL